MECFNCLGLSNHYYETHDGKCVCSRSCYQQIWSPNIEEDIASHTGYDDHRIRKIEVLFLKACLKRSKTEQLKKLREKHLEAMTELLMEAQDDLNEGSYLRLSKSLKKQADGYLCLIDLYGSP